jgi:hypothetical protein
MRWPECSDYRYEDAQRLLVPPSSSLGDVDDIMESSAWPAIARVPLLRDVDVCLEPMVTISLTDPLR